MKRSSGIGGLFIAAIIILAAYGWIANIISLARMDWSLALNIEGVLRIVGVVVAPLGVAMGLFV